MKLELFHAPKDGSPMRLALAYAEQVGCVVQHKGRKKGCVVWHPKGRPTRLVFMEGRHSAPPALTSWLRRLGAVLEHDKPGATELAARVAVDVVAERVRRENEAKARAAQERAEQEIQREREAEAQRAREAAAKQAAPVEREGTTMVGGRSWHESTKQEKRRLTGLIFKEQQRLQVSDIDLAQLLGLNVHTIERWRGGQPAAAPFARLREWGDVLRAMPTPTGPAALPEPAGRQLALAVKAAAVAPPDHAPRPALAPLKVERPEGSVVRLGPLVLDMATLSDLDLLTLSQGVNAELLRRAKGSSL